MSYVQDGNFNAAAQDGAKQVSLPFQAVGNFYAKEYIRKYKSVATAYIPVRNAVGAFTNLALYSEDFSNSAWTKTDSTISTNTKANPSDGSVTMDSLLEAATTAQHIIQQNISFVTGIYTFSVVVGALGRDYIILQLFDGATGWRVSYQLSTLAKTIPPGYGAPVDTRIISLGNGNYRITITASLASGSGNVIIFCTDDGTAHTYLGDVTKGLYIWGASVVLASELYPYVANTSVSRAVSVPLVDNDDPLAFLVDESAPDAAALETGMAQWQRTYANVPSPIVRYSTMPINKPSASGIGTLSGTFTKYNSPLDDGTALGLGYTYGGAFFANNQVFSLKAASSSLATPSGGTFTLTYKTSTTGAIAYNAADGTINTAINGLADVISDGLTFSATNRIASYPSISGYVSFAVTVGTTTSRVTMNAGSVTPSGASSAFTRIVSGTVQNIYIASFATITSHGFTSTADLFLLSSTPAAIPDAQWDVVDANTIKYNWAFGGATTYSSIGQSFRSYTPGAAKVETKLTKTFYLPGFTAGIASPTDIPIPSLPLTNPTAFLTALIATTTGFLTYDSNPLDFWMAPIYQQEVIEINMANI